MAKTRDISRRPLAVQAMVLKSEYLENIRQSLEMIEASSNKAVINQIVEEHRKKHNVDAFRFAGRVYTDVVGMPISALSKAPLDKDLVVQMNKLIDLQKQSETQIRYIIQVLSRKMYAVKNQQDIRDCTPDMLTKIANHPIAQLPRLNQDLNNLSPEDTKKFEDSISYFMGLRFILG